MPFDYTNDYPKNNKPEDEGRKGDTVLAHLTVGELVVPKPYMDEPEFYDLIKRFFDEADIDINQYIVGNKANSINPETGYPEFGFLSKTWKKIKRAVKKVVSKIIPTPKIPKPPKPPKPKEQKKSVSGKDRRSKADQQVKQKSRGDRSTVKTGTRGVMQPANTANTTLLGAKK